MDTECQLSEGHDTQFSEKEENEAISDEAFSANAARLEGGNIKVRTETVYHIGTRVVSET
jgi:hypothetical protein